MHQDTKPQGGDVLVVDDDLAIIQLVTELLEDEGYTVRSACDGLEAWQAIEDAPPRLLMTDICMPRMTGSELVTRLRARGYGFPILIIAATPALAAPLLHFDSIMYVTKPFHLNVLLDAVQQYVAPAVVEVV
jgi:two-component system chemotaxis response regulator CheY